MSVQVYTNCQLHVKVSETVSHPNHGHIKVSQVRICNIGSTNRALNLYRTNGFLGSTISTMTKPVWIHDVRADDGLSSGLQANTPPAPRVKVSEWSTLAWACNCNGHGKQCDDGLSSGLQARNIELCCLRAEPHLNLNSVDEHPPQLCQCLVYVITVPLHDFAFGFWISSRAHKAQPKTGRTPMKQPLLGHWISECIRTPCGLPWKHGIKENDWWTIENMCGPPRCKETLRGWTACYPPWR